MHPILLQIGGFSIKTYGFLVATGFLVGIIVALKEARRIGYDPQFILDLSFYIILGAIIGSRLFYVVTHISYYRDNPVDALKVWQGGLTFFGGFILAAVVCVWMIRKKGLGIWKTLDLFAPSMAIGVFFGRLGCFSAGCCYGKPCDLPWAVTFTDIQSLAMRNIPLHPTQLYSSFGALITFIVLMMLRKRKSFDGQLALTWVLCYSGFRSLIELFRGDPRGDLISGTYPVSQVMALLLFFCALAAFPVLKFIQSRRNEGEN